MNYTILKHEVSNNTDNTQLKEFQNIEPFQAENKIII